MKTTKWKCIPSIFANLLYINIKYTPSAMWPDGANRLILKNGNNPCEGHIEVYHNSKWGYVGDTKWSRNTEEVVCRSTHCGKPVSTEHILRPNDSTVWLNEITCNGQESDLWDCLYPGWGISTFRKDDMKKIKCSSKAGLLTWNVEKYTVKSAKSNPMSYRKRHDDDGDDDDFECKWTRTSFPSRWNQNKPGRI